jgi:hypothetical protein
MKLFLKSMMVSSLALSAYAYETKKGPAPSIQAADPNPSARWGTKGDYNWYLETDFVYFRPETTISLEELSMTRTTSSNSTKRSYTNFFEHSFNPGVRVQLGCNTSFDGWDFNAQYFGYFYKKSQTFQWNETPDVPPLNPQPSRSNTQLIKVNYHINQGDFDLGRMYRVSNHLKFRPHAGVRALWFNQTFSYNQSTLVFPPVGAVINNVPSYQYENVKATINSTLAGVQLGSEGCWMFTPRVSAYTNITGALLFMTQSATTDVESNPTADYGYGKTSPYNMIIPGFDIEIGLRWDRNFFDDKFHLGLKLGYELHTLINFNSYPSINAVKENLTGNSFSPDFSLQGIVAGLRFDF